MSFATLQEFADFLNIPLPTGTDAAQAQAMLDAATTEMIREMGGQTILQTTETIQIDASGRYMLRLPQRPVTAVSSVSVATATNTSVLTVSTDVEWHDDGRLYRVDGTWWGPPRSPGWPRYWVNVTYTHGYATVPTELRDVCRQYAARKLENPTEAKSDSAGAVSETYFGQGFTDDEQAVLRDFGGVLVG